jgi:heptaprenyl diphosphate synthase
LITLPALYYFENNPDESDLRWVVSGNQFADSQMDRLIASIRDSGAIEQSLEEARRYVDRGLEILEKQPESEERDALRDLANYIVRRTM